MPRFPFILFLRIVFRNREVYLLKIITLSVAFASSTVVILFCLSEFGYDRFHENAHAVFRVIERTTTEDHNGNRLSDKIPVAIYNTLVSRPGDSMIVSRVTIMNGLTVVGGGESLYSGKVHSADAAITNILSFDVVDGSTDDFHNKDRQAILSSSTAQLLFGTEKASGQTIGVYSLDDTLQFRVAAVYQDFPQNSHEEFELFVLFDTVAVESLGFSAGRTGVYCRVIDSGITEEQRRLQSEVTGKHLVYFFQPLPEIYFGPRISGEDSKHGDSYSILILICLTGLILFLALTSYVNLTSLTIPYRAKELAIRKLAGTNQYDLFFIFFKESVLIVAVSFLFGVIFLILTADFIEAILSIDLPELVLDADVALFSIVTGILLILILSPLFLTFKFIRSSPNRLLSTEKITFPRFKRTITVLQLGVSIFLIVASMVIKRQIDYSLLKEPGRNYDQVVYLDYPADLTKDGLFSIRSGWQIYHPNIVDVIALSQLPDRINSKELNSPFYSLAVDPFFPGFFKLNMIHGNWFKPNAADSILVLNDRGMQQITAAESKNVIGTIEDINIQFNLPQKPIKFKIEDNARYNYLCVRILEVDIRRTIRYLTTFFNGSPVYVLNKRFDEWIKYQDRLNSLSNLLGIISALLSCCAIYGLSVSLVRDKLKQIAVHKICGANSRNIALLLAREFVRETIIAILIFGPVTYIFVSEFMREFVYATRFQWQDPVLPLVFCVLVITMLCGFQASTLNRKDLSSALKN